MNKRILCLVLALVMVLGAFSAVFAAESKVEVKDVPKYTSTDHKIQWLQDNGIVSGRKVNANGENNDLALDKTILRGEVTKLLVYAIGKQDLATQLANVVRAFKDVEPTHWANGYIAVGTTSASPANGLPFLNGYPDGTFHADWNVNYAELAKMLVVLTKKDLTPAMVKSANANWPSTWLTWAAQGGILDGVKYVNSSDNAVRKDAFAMIYNALYAMKEWRLYPTSEQIGVISGYKTGKLYLNGDEKKEFVVNENTYFVPANDKVGRYEHNAILWSALVTKYGTDSAYYLGSLVRVITNDKNEVTHIIQLGNPVNLDLETKGWEPIADGHFHGEVALREADITFTSGAKLRVDSKTRYFVADAAKGQFGELKDMAEVRAKLFNHTSKVAKSVYVGFERVQVTNDRIARLVVFNEVDSDKLVGDVVRISEPVTSKYNVVGQKAGFAETEKVMYNLSNFRYYPFGYKGVDRLDVAKLNKFNGTIENIIDHKNAPIYEITKLFDREYNELTLTGPYAGLRAIELTDGDYKAKFAVTEDTKAWFGNQLAKGARVQVKFNDANTEITYISVLPEKEALRGVLPVGTLIGQKDVKFVKILAPKNNDGFVVIQYTDKDGRAPRTAAVFVGTEPFAPQKGAILRLIPTVSAQRFTYKGELVPVYALEEIPAAEADKTEENLKAKVKAVEEALANYTLEKKEGEYADEAAIKAEVLEYVTNQFAGYEPAAKVELSSFDKTNKKFKFKATVKDKSNVDKTVESANDITYAFKAN